VRIAPPAGDERSGAILWALVACTALAWGSLIAPSLSWLGTTLARPDSRLHALLLACILVAAVVRGRGVRFAVSPRLGPWLGVLTAASLYVALRLGPGIHKLEVAVAALGTHALVGLCAERCAWRRGLVPVLLAIAALPFAEHLDVYVGFPARLLSARILEDAFTGAGLDGVTAQTILVFEGRAAQIDLPCSGVKSLWAGSVLYLALTWLADRRITAGWLAGWAAYMGLLFLGNVARIGVLVGLGMVLELPRAAESLHVSLGVLVFVGAALLPWWALHRRHREIRDLQPGAEAPSAPTGRAAWGLIALSACLWTLHLVAPHRVAASTPVPTATLRLPADVSSQPIALTPTESTFFTAGGATLASKQRFEWRGVSGSVLVVRSRAARAQHLPEQCLAASGLDVAATYTRLIDADFPVRHVELRRATGHAAYWFQSSERVTDDFTDRLWAGLTSGEADWALVSVLLDRAPAPRDEAALLARIRAAVSLQMKKELP